MAKQSAKIPGRPIFNLMLDRIEKGDAGGILSWHPDRLARNSIDGGKIIYLLDTGVIQTLKFPSFWFESTPQGKFMLNIAFCAKKFAGANVPGLPPLVILTIFVLTPLWWTKRKPQLF